jgi:hypothetical protein
MYRSFPKFQHLRPKVLPPGVIQLSDLQLLEGLAGRYSRHGKDIVQIIVGWRYSAAKTGVPLHLFAAGNGFQLPLCQHILRSSAALKEKATNR